ncbi:site-specific integrase [Sphaerisporangium album]|uniref:Site-specific integrase n=1 Tax=Sphaerisporangium album TaxID=509200 RepID=A0A367FRX3_9ACTN|nr:site-specific integrase [Sphaerisporangium album]RCG32974.1 site-specific integrase [Sphaerisporangium album]
MIKRRSRGDGGLHWDESRNRWIASITVGYTPAGKRIVRKASDKDKTKARAKLKKLVRDHEDGLIVASKGYTVADAVRYWLTYGLSDKSPSSLRTYTSLADNHIIPSLGARKLKELSAEDVDKWLKEKSTALSTEALRRCHSILNRAVRMAQARDKVKRNVVALCDVPTGLAGRPSKAFTLMQAEAVLKSAEGTPLEAYIVLSLLIGARTEELRALVWPLVDLVGKPDDDPPVPPSIMVWRSVRAGGDTKTRKSRRTLALPQRCVRALSAHQERQAAARKAAGEAWPDSKLVFTSSAGTPLDAANVRRDFRRILSAAGLDPKKWTPREMRHSFVSLLSDSGVPLENISRLVGHNGSAITEKVYRKQIRPMLLEGAEAMDRIFPQDSAGA